MTTITDTDAPMLLEPPVSAQMRDVRFHVQSLRSELADIRRDGPNAKASQIEGMSLMLNMLASKVHKLEERVAAQENKG